MKDYYQQICGLYYEVCKRATPYETTPFGTEGWEEKEDYDNFLHLLKSEFKNTLVPLQEVEFLAVEEGSGVGKFSTAYLKVEDDTYRYLIGYRLVIQVKPK